MVLQLILKLITPVLFLDKSGFRGGFILIKLTKQDFRHISPLYFNHYLCGRFTMLY